MSILLSLTIFSLFLQVNDAFLSPASTSTCIRSKNCCLGAADTSGVAASLEDCLFQGVETMNKVMTPDFFDSSPSLKTMYSQITKNVQVDESSIPGAGQGLFAKKNIKSGTIIGFYPAHSLGVETNDKSLFSCFPQDQDYFQKNPASGSAYLHCTDQPLFQRTSLLAQVSDEWKDIPLYLDVNPQNEVIPGWVSQFINDGAIVESNSEQGVLDYYQRSGQQRNCIHIPWGPSPIIATVTTKKVKKGDELLTSYGGVFWAGVLFSGEAESVFITPAIQTKIQETAKELLKCIQGASVVYAKQTEEMQVEFQKLHESL